jgi:apolipoprotein D and lipocalin family protein
MQSGIREARFCYKMPPSEESTVSLVTPPPATARPIGGRPGVALLIFMMAFAFGCAGGRSGIRPLGGAAEDGPIDLPRFMGDWYVVAHIPTRPERNAWEALEQYQLRDDGDIDVRFSFCEGGFDGEPKVLEMRGWVVDPATNAEWRVRPFWPLALDYQVLELDAAYTRTVIGHPSGSYAWIMARQPDGVSEAEIEAITARLAARGYEVEKMRRVPQGDGACRAEATE